MPDQSGGRAEALTLRKHLQGPAPLNAAAFFGEIAGQIAGPWQFSAIADLGYPGVEGRPTSLMTPAIAGGG